MSDNNLVYISNDCAVELIRLLQKYPELRASDARRKLNSYRLRSAILYIVNFEKEMLSLELGLQRKLGFRDLDLSIIRQGFKDGVQVLQKGNFEIVSLGENHAVIRLLEKSPLDNGVGVVE